MTKWLPLRVENADERRGVMYVDAARVIAVSDPTEVRPGVSTRVVYLDAHGAAYIVLDCPENRAALELPE